MKFIKYIQYILCKFKKCIMTIIRQLQIIDK